ncbi:hypothetical protein [Hydrocarboniclastica marina]|uniref:Toxin CptA n=1 Tax=Hydrocarboniclastica marina TaxID=2259620 RepID=A0A4P7XEJ3_9ALTE|nr:hypothetical protein [Hydrocarboniclastica marina]MAL99740.1 hypothetical protein [Alteromonadaceae bacterium]QCF25286.1 hypothetical protein soil367_04700 [Hydrocarboniclastica marina]
MPNPNVANDLPVVVLRLRRSPGLACAVLVAWAPLLVLAGFAGGSGALGLCLMACLVALAVRSAVPYGLTRAEARPQLRIQENRLRSQLPGEPAIEWNPARTSRLLSRLVWLELAPVGHRGPRWRLLVTDLPGLGNVPREDFRQLKVWLRMGARYD